MTDPLDLEAIKVRLDGLSGDESFLADEVVTLIAEVERLRAQNDMLQASGTRWLSEFDALYECVRACRSWIHAKLQRPNDSNMEEWQRMCKAMDAWEKLEPPKP